MRVLVGRASVGALIGAWLVACASLSADDAERLQHAQTTLGLAYNDSVQQHDGDANGAFAAARAMTRGAFCGINGVLVRNDKATVDAGIECVTSAEGGSQ